MGYSENSLEYETRQTSKGKLNINKKSKEILKRGIALVMAGVIAAGTLVAYFRYKNKKTYEENRQTISEYYGENSEENNVLRYLDLNRELDELNIDKYLVNNSLYDELNIDNSLSTPAYIDLQILKLKEMINTKISNKDLNSLYEFVSTVAFLKKQRTLINTFIYGEGYDTVYGDYVDSLKENAAEVYNLEEPSKILFQQNASMSSGETNISLAYPKPGYENIQYGEYNNHNSYSTNVKGDIKKGVEGMINIQRIQNGDYSDKEVLKKYTTALAQAIDFQTDVDENDLYNRKEESRLKGK